MDFTDKIKYMESKQTVRFLKYGIGCLVFLLILILIASASNVNNYYLYYRDAAVEVWKGRFSPNGKERVIMMPGMPAPDSIKEVYSREEVFPIISRFYISKANALLDVPGKPDYDEIKNYLYKALSYATTDTLRETVHARLNSIDVMMLIYKADVAAGRRTLSGFEEALEYLSRASSLDPGVTEKNLIHKRIRSVQEGMANLKKD